MALRHTREQLQQYLSSCHPVDMREAIVCWVGVVAVSVGEISGVVAQLRAFALNYRQAALTTPTSASLFADVANSADKLAEVMEALVAYYPRAQTVAYDAARELDDVGVMNVADKLLVVVDDYLSAVEGARRIAALLATQEGYSIQHGINFQRLLDETIRAWERSSGADSILEEILRAVFGRDFVTKMITGAIVITGVIAGGAYIIRRARGRSRY